MAFATREQIASALFAIVDTAVGRVVNLKTSARRIKLPQDVAPSQTPALFQVQVKEHYERSPGHLIGIPPKRTMLFDLVLYVTDAANTAAGLTVFPSTQLNLMIQAIENAFFQTTEPSTDNSTLGGLVASARVEGEIDYHEARTLDDKSIAIIPITVVIP